MDALASSLADLAERVERATAREALESGDDAATGQRRAAAAVKRRLTVT
jgi:hypothetical protein